MNKDDCQVITTALYCAIIATHDTFIKKGVSDKLSYVFTKGVLLDTLVKSVDLISKSEADHE